MCCDVNILTEPFAASAYITSSQAPNGQWHEMNDSTVTIVSPQHVLKQQAYILFYSKDVDIPSNGTSHSGGAGVVHSQGDGVTGRPKESKSSSHLNGNSDVTLSVSVSVSGDDLGEALTVKEKSALSLSMLSHIHNVASSSSSSSHSRSQSEPNSEDVGGDIGNESECSNMIYVDRDTRLKRKYSWAVKPFRCVSQFCYF